MPPIPHAAVVDLGACGVMDERSPVDSNRLAVGWIVAGAFGLGSVDEAMTSVCLESARTARQAAAGDAASCHSEKRFAPVIANRAAGDDAGCAVVIGDSMIIVHIASLIIHTAAVVAARSTAAVLK